jgi:hypothetical protein
MAADGLAESCGTNAELSGGMGVYRVSKRGIEIAMAATRVLP